MNKHKIIIFISALAVIFFAARQLTQPRSADPQSAFQTQIEPAALMSASSTPIEQKNEPVSSTETKTRALPVAKNNPAEAAGTSTVEIGKTILLDMPFTSQAPFAEWSDLRQQDGCEEASALMAVHWAKGLGALTKIEAKKEILAIAAFEEETYQNYVDTSGADTLKIIIKEHLNYQNALLKKDSGIEEIKRELAAGNALILPMDGKKLKNPNFKNGGPDRHNIVIRGYDPATKEFITNDPGTRKGEGYRYPEKIIETAWRDYPTGDHLPIVGIRKNMIVVMPTIKK